MNRGRDPSQLLQHLDASSATRLVVTASRWPKSMPVMEIVEAARRLGITPGIDEDVADAIELARRGATGELVLVAGSIYVIGEARQALLSAQGN